ncbi:MAG: tetratricopeptide repeat protein [Candidatus Marinimicrobia bacterium]|nr:tetratricopeptide repeat protein [Candidatus Neomarinimicrobiota bacterium]
MRNRIIYASFIIIFLSGFVLQAQKKTEVLTRSDKKKAIEKAGQLLSKFYVYPEVGFQMEKYLKSLNKEGTFNKIIDPNEFVKTLTTELRSINNDKHLFMYVGSNPDEQSKEDRYLNRLIRRIDREKDNFGLNRVEILDGNIGYLNIESVMYSEESVEVLSSALKFLSNTYAIIFDLRYNHRGRDPMYMSYLFSYFFENPTHINSIYWRDRNRTDEFWTQSEVPGKKMVDIPLFVLISSETFSGAEEFAYDLQALKRATIIGEVSAGGANPASTWVVYEDLRISIPFGRAINPITGTNWEGVGVKPDIEVPADKALEIAIREAKTSAHNYYTTKKDKLVTDYNECNSSLERAEILFTEDKAKEAEKLVISSLKKAVDIELLNQSAINQLGYDYLNQYNKLMAIAIFKTNVLVYPESADVYDSLGEAYLENGNEQKAIQYYKKALEIDPNYATALRALEEINE